MPFSYFPPLLSRWLTTPWFLLIKTSRRCVKLPRSRLQQPTIDLTSAPIVIYHSDIKTHNFLLGSTQRPSASGSSTSSTSVRSRPALHTPRLLCGPVRRPRSSSNSAAKYPSTFATRLVFCAALSAVLNHLPIKLQSTQAPWLTPDSSQLRQNTINDVLDIRPLFLQVHDRSSLFEARLVTPCKNNRGIVYGASLRLYVSNSQTRQGPSPRSQRCHTLAPPCSD
jgi:hypothetical protein